MQTAIATNALYKDRRHRVWELDVLRGASVVAMLVDHLMYDFAAIDGWLSNFYSVNNPFINFMNMFARKYWTSTFRLFAHPFFVFLFLFIVGTSCSFSRDNTRRGAALGVAAMVFTGITLACRAMGIMRYGVIFGILDCIAISILIAAALDIMTAWNEKLNVYAPLVIGVVILAFGIYDKFWAYTLDAGMWDSLGFKSENLIKYIMGTRAYGDDWFGIFPWVGIVLVGMYWGKTAYKTRVSLMPALDGKWNKPLAFIGRHALVFYFLHQAILTGLVLLLCLMLGYKVAL